MNFLSNLFGKLQSPFTKKKIDNVKNNNTVLKELKLGDLVYLKFKTPNEIGIISGQNLIFTRLNREEIDKRDLEGSVSFIQQPSEMLKSYVIEIATYGSPTMPGILRKMTFLEDEIETIRKVNK
jgi:hypothetical protein